MGYRVSLWTHTKTPPAFRFCRFRIGADTTVLSGGKINTNAGIARPTKRPTFINDENTTGAKFWCRCGKLYGPKPDGVPRLREAACWAHLRRDFHDFWATTKSEIAREALDRIGKLYDIERDINGQPADMRHAAHQKLSLPKVVAFFAWSEQQLLRIPGKSDLAKAFRYGLRRQEAFSLFLADVRVAIDHNPAERALRPIAKRGSLCCPSSSICKHWKCDCIEGATRACFSGYSTFDRFRGEIFGANLIGGAGDDLNCGQYAGFDKVPDPVVCYA